MNPLGPSRLPASPHELVHALLTILEAQHRCLDAEDLDGVLALAAKRDEVQARVLALGAVPADLHEPLRRLAREGDRLIERMGQLVRTWQTQEAQSVQQVRGMQLYVEEGQTPNEARFLDRHK